MLRLIKAALLLAVMTPALTACGESGQPSGQTMKPTVTIAEANRIVDDYLEQGRRLFSPEAKLIDTLRKDAMACDDPTDSGPKGRVFATRTVELRDIPPAQTAENFTTIRNWWQQNGFKITAERPDALFAEHSGNGYRMSLKTNSQHIWYLGASSPCVWPNGTPEPKS